MSLPGLRSPPSSRPTGPASPARWRRRLRVKRHHAPSRIPDSIFRQPLPSGYSFAISRRDAPEFCDERPRPLEQRTRRTPDAQRIRSPVCKSEKHTSVVTTNTPDTPGVPHAMVGTACFALSPVDGLFRHRSGNYDLSPPSRTKRRLAVSFRRQHRGARTTRLQPSASCAVVIRRTFHVPDRTPQAATASRPAYRDDRERPS